MRTLSAAATLLWSCCHLLAQRPAFGQITIHPSGHITHSGSTSAVEIAYDFGLPPVAPEKQDFEARQVPIVITTWLHDGIRYSQTAFLSRLDSGDLQDATNPSVAGVLFVRLTGLNTTNEYTLAKAALAQSKDGAPCPLELRDQLVYPSGTEGSRFVAALDIPSGAFTRTAGGQLEFEGKMPPGTSGSLVIRIPVGRFDATTQVTRLQDLDFDEEYQRVKKFWAARARDGATQRLPLCFGTTPK